MLGRFKVRPFCFLAQNLRVQYPKAVAGLMLALLAKKVKLRLTIDRTEWDFGKCQVNILMVLVGCGELQLPIYWELLDNKSGNANSRDRVDLLEKCFAIVDSNRIGLVIGDREFVGHQWIKYLKDKALNFVMRFPKHHSITTTSGQILLISDLKLAVGASFGFNECQVDGCWGKVWVKRLDENDYLYLFGSVEVSFWGNFTENAGALRLFFKILSAVVST